MKYSERLGEIKKKQFQKALDRFHLGKFVKAESIPYGNFGQNVFLTSAQGEYVLRGKPHTVWQFNNEKIMIDLLHQKTNTPVPYPFLIDENNDIFGWNYAIMPRLKGLQSTDEKIQARLKISDWKEIAKAYALNLIEMHKLTYNYSGKYTDGHKGIKQFDPSFASWVIKSILELVNKSITYNNLFTKTDKIFVDNLIKEGKNDLNKPFIPTFTIQDYHRSNTLINKIGNKWHVSGVFDFMESYFGDSEVDLSRMYINLYDLNKEYGYIFIETYLANKKIRSGFEKRFPIYLALDRLIIWEWANRNKKVWWNKNLTFREWIDPYLNFYYLL